MTKALPLMVFLLSACSTGSTVRVIAYPWLCGEPKFDCYTIGYEVDLDRAPKIAAQVCLDGAKTIIPNAETRKALIVCK